jgi:hypothetical protein
MRAAREWAPKLLEGHCRKGGGRRRVKSRACCALPCELDATAPHPAKDEVWINRVCTLPDAHDAKIARTSPRRGALLSPRGAPEHVATWHNNACAR